MKVQILGTGCPKCKKLTKLVEKTVKKNNIDAAVEKVTDLKEIMAMGVMSTPALAIDGEVKTTGRMLSEEEVLQYLS